MLVARLSEPELAELAGCSLDDVRGLVDLGILVPRDGDEPFRSPDAHLVRLMAAFDRAGISLDDVARGVASGDLTFRLDLFLSEPRSVSGTYEGLAADLKRSPELLRRLSSELGVPPLADDRIRSDDAEMVSRIVTALDVVTTPSSCASCGSTAGAFDDSSSLQSSSSTERCTDGSWTSTCPARRRTS